MKLFRSFLISLSMILVLVFVIACAGNRQTNGTPQAETLTDIMPTSQDNVLYLNLIWHQHQPLYYMDENGIYTRPWVRVHGTKDYYDMASTVAKYSNVHVTFNLTPVLLRQLNDFANDGAKDIYWQLAEKPASSLTNEDKRFLLQRFFDANSDHIIARFPRYQQLLEKRGGTDIQTIDAGLQSFTEQDYRDLQLWFNLAWFDPDFLTQAPLNSLVDKGRNFSEEDKIIIFSEARNIIQKIIPLHKTMQDNKQIEIITTPYAHPILPLVYSTKLALVGNPSAMMPELFTYPNDAIEQLNKSVDIYQQYFGKSPRGLWPGEGAVSQEVVPLIAQSGYQWMASGEPVLAQSLGIGNFTRNSDETVQQADALYRPYFVQGDDGKKVAIFFRDGVISDKLGFTYSGLSGEVAAQDLMQRLENIQNQIFIEGAKGPHIISIILDGENAWEYYDNDGKEFLNAFYRLLSESKTIKTVTPSEYLAMFPQQLALDHLFSGAWFSPNYDTWIGEKEEQTAWNYLGWTRAELAKYDLYKKKMISMEALAQAQDYMYLAEGSDWFWWYGSDQDSGQDEYFDTGFRALLAGVYETLGVKTPNFVNTPIIPRDNVQPIKPVQGLSSPLIDGIDSPNEWEQSAVYPADGLGGVGFNYLFDTKNLYIKLNGGVDDKSFDMLGVYIGAPDSVDNSAFAHQEDETLWLGFSATNLFEWKIGEDQLKMFLPENGIWTSGESTGEIVASTNCIEIAIPWQAMRVKNKEISALNSGDELKLTLLIREKQRDNATKKSLLPAAGPTQLIVPDIGNITTLLNIDDPLNDDHGPGTYTYPDDVVFEDNVFDLRSFQVAYNDQDYIFKFEMAAPITNPWGAGNNLALQTLDVYIDIDPGEGTGSRLLLPGRNAALESGNGWDFMLWAEGWTPQIITPDPTSGDLKTLNAEFKIVVNAPSGEVTLRIPKNTISSYFQQQDRDVGNPIGWGFVAAVLSQDGFPSTGVWRVRDINQIAEQWRFGGASTDTNHTRIIDLALSADFAPTQENILSNFTSSTISMGELVADDFSQIPLLRP